MLLPDDETPAEPEDFTFEIPTFTFDEAPLPMVAAEITAPAPQAEVREDLGGDKDLTEADIDEMFANITANVENDATVLAAAASVIEAEAVVAKAIETREAAETEIKELSQEAAKMQQLLNSINNRLAEKKNLLWNVRNIEREKKRHVTEAETLVEMARQAVAAQNRMDASQRNYHLLAKDKRWYEGYTNGNGIEMKILKHQWAGATYLASHGRAILGDGMGLGKTLTAIAALDLVKSKRTLVVTPADVASNFVEEVRMWAPHRSVITMKGKTRITRNTVFTALSFMEEFVLVVNYEVWRSDSKILDRLINLGFDTVILDESHMIKSTSSEAYRGTRALVETVNACPHDNTILTLGEGSRMRVCDKCSWAGHHFDTAKGTTLMERYLMQRSVKNLWCMTGTTILNAPQDIYAPLSLIDPQLFWNKNGFLRTYCTLDPYTSRWQFRSGGLESLKVELKSKFLARELGDTDIVLPPQYPTLHKVQIDAQRYPLQLRTIVQLTQYAQVVLSSGKSMNAMAKIALITRQRQANVWPGGIKIYEDILGDGVKKLVFDVSEEVRESIKMDKAIEIIAEATARGERVVLFSQFSTALEELHSRINGMCSEDGHRIFSVRFDGSTPPSVKEEIKSNFNKNKGEAAKWDVVLANYKTGGVGLNLTACTRTIILDEEWNPGKRDQAYARTHRIGQDETTFVDVIRIDSTIDTWLARLIEQKEALLGGFNEATADFQAEWLRAIENGEIDGSGE